MGKTILVMDGDSSIRIALSKVLHKENYEVVSAGNSREAVEKFELRQIDLALIDLGLPVKDGWHTLEWLSRVNPLLPVVIITGRTHQRESAQKMGAVAIMEKPLNVPRLLQLIRDLTNEPVEHHPWRESGFELVPGDQEFPLKNGALASQPAGQMF
jgi:DNA-binding NtrC family response regulator